jgi:uncharacterized protein
MTAVCEQHAAMSTDASPVPSLGAKALMRVIGIYQVVRGGKPSPCRFVPTCSAYAIEALGRHGAWRGSLLAVHRVGRCHPFGRHGVDPVPG